MFGPPRSSPPSPTTPFSRPLPPPPPRVSGWGRAGWRAAAGCRRVGAKKRSPRPPRARARQALSRRAAVDGGLLPASRSTDISCPFVPRMLDLHLELGILRAPPERLDGPGRVGNQLRRISGPSRYHLRGNSTPGYPSRGFQHVFNGCPSAGSEAEPVVSSPLFQ